MPVTDSELDALIARMTPAEKAGQLTQYFYLAVPADAGSDFVVDSEMAGQPEMVEAALRGGGAGSLFFVSKPEETNRLQRVAIEDSRLGSVYLPPFEAAVHAGAGNVMSAYMDLNGIPASGNSWLFTEVLRDTWGFEGFVVSDANAVRNLVTHGFAADLADAAARAVNAG